MCKVVVCVCVCRPGYTGMYLSECVCVRVCGFSAVTYFCSLCVNLGKKLLHRGSASTLPRCKMGEWESIRQMHVGADVLLHVCMRTQVK